MKKTAKLQWKTTKTFSFRGGEPEPKPKKERGSQHRLLSSKSLAKKQPTATSGSTTRNVAQDSSSGTADEILSQMVDAELLEAMETEGN